MSPFLFLPLLTTVILGTTIVLISSNWFVIWLGLEINTLAFLPLLINNHHPRATEATTKYFLIQALASALLLFAGLTQAYCVNSWSVHAPMTTLSATIILFAVSLKMAVAPCHGWLPDVLQALPYWTGLILSTWQKIAPFYIITTLPPQMAWTFLTLGILSAVVGGWGGLNQTQVRKLLAFSSIAHLGWIIVVLPFSPQLSTLNLVLYFIITSTLFLTLNILNTPSLADFTNAINIAPWLTTLTLLTILSLGGLPPLTGFLGKWLILQELASNTAILVTAGMILGSLLSLFFYLRVTYIITLTISPQHSTTILSWRASRLNRPQNNLSVSALLTLSVLGLSFIPTWIPLFF